MNEPRKDPSSRSSAGGPAGPGEVVVSATRVITEPGSGSPGSRGEAPVSRSRRRKLVAWIGVAFGVLYLLNPTFGLFEILPDNLPLVGNLDEAGAAALVLFGLRYLGLDLFPGKTDR